jgi:hypothetical protein
VVSPSGHVVWQIGPRLQLPQIGIQVCGYLLAGTFLLHTGTRIVGQDRFDVPYPAMSHANLGLHGAETGTHPLNDLEQTL